MRETEARLTPLLRHLPADVALDLGVGEAQVVYDSALEALSLRTTDGAGVLTDRVTMEAGEASPEVVFNEPGADMDVRFEGDTDASLLVVDAGNDAVLVGRSAPVGSEKLSVAGDALVSGDVVFDRATNDVTLTAEDQATGAATLTVPDLGGVDGEVVVDNLAQTLSNKTLDGAVIAGSAKHPDNVKAIYGSGNDAEIFFDGTDLIVDPDSQGNGGVDIRGPLAQPVSGGGFVQKLVRKTGLSDATATDVFTIAIGDVGSDGGAIHVKVSGIAVAYGSGNPPTNSAAQAFEYRFGYTNWFDIGTVSPVTEIYESGNITNNSGQKNVNGVTMSISGATDTTITVQFTIDFSGSAASAAGVFAQVEVIWEGAFGRPIISEA